MLLKLSYLIIYFDKRQFKNLKLFIYYHKNLNFWWDAIIIFISILNCFRILWSSYQTFINWEISYLKIKSRGIFYFLMLPYLNMNKFLIIILWSYYNLLRIIIIITVLKKWIKRAKISHELILIRTFILYSVYLEHIKDLT